MVNMYRVTYLFKTPLASSRISSYDGFTYIFPIPTSVGVVATNITSRFVTDKGLRSCKTFASAKSLVSVLSNYPWLFIKSCTAFLTFKFNPIFPRRIIFPKNLFSSKSVCWPNTNTPFVSNLVRAWHLSILHMPFSTTHLGTKPSGFCPVWSDFELNFTYLTRLYHFYLIANDTIICKAKNLGMNFIGIEREPEYFEIAKKRIS